MLLEDALLLHDAKAVAALFEDAGVLVTGLGAVAAREQAADVFAEHDFVASTRSVNVLDDIAVVVGDHTVNISYRGIDKKWRLVVAIVLPTLVFALRPKAR